MHHQFGSFAVGLEALKSYRRTPYFRLKRYKVKIRHSSGFFGAYNDKIDQKMVSYGTPPPWLSPDFCTPTPPDGMEPTLQCRKIPRIFPRCSGSTSRPKHLEVLPILDARKTR